MLDLFIDELFSRKCIPSFLWRSEHLFQCIQNVHRDSDNSVVAMASQLKTELRSYFSLPGAFMSLLNSKEFVLPNWSRISWFVGKKQTRALLPLSSDTKATKDDGFVFELVQKMRNATLHRQLCQRICNKFELAPHSKVVRGGTAELGKSDMKWLLGMLCQLQERLIYSKSSYELAHCTIPPSEYSIGVKTNEYIILAGHLASNKTLNPDTTKAFVEDILEWFGSALSWLENDVGSMAVSPTVQPRRDVAKRLILHPPSGIRQCSLVQARRLAFHVFQSRVMTLSDWYGRYFDIVANQNQSTSSASANESVFFLAVHELVHCGFIRKIVGGGRREESYEKVAIAWGSGR